MSRSLADSRWTAKRKAEIVRLIRAGDLSREQACRAHAISPEELETWLARYDDGGVQALRATIRAA